MTDYGETSTGFRSKTFDETGADIRARMRALIDQNLTLDDKDPLGNIVDVCSDELALAWEALEVGRNQFDPDNAEGPGAVALASVTGTKRRLPTKGTAICSVNLGASKTFLPGTMVAHVSGEPDNRWVNRDTIVSTVAATYINKVFVAETAGNYPAALNTITKIAQTASGWNSITNTSAATPGKDLETIPELMVRREQELGSQGTGTVKSIRNAVLAVTGVIDCTVNYNDTTAVVGNLQPNQLEVVVWDGTVPTALDDEIAQAILDTKSAASSLYGAQSGTAIDAYGETKTIAFTRATSTASYVAVTVSAPASAIGTIVADVRASIQAIWPTAVGAGVYASKLILGPAALSAVVDVTSLTVGLSVAPVTTSIPPAANTVRLSPPNGNINVTVTVL
jgi:uncharacterized phage protein gp47/JayE